MRVKLTKAELDAEIKLLADKTIREIKAYAAEHGCDSRQMANEFADVLIEMAKEEGRFKFLRAGVADIEGKLDKLRKIADEKPIER